MHVHHFIVFLIFILYSYVILCQSKNKHLLLVKIIWQILHLLNNYYDEHSICYHFAHVADLYIDQARDTDLEPTIKLCLLAVRYTGWEHRARGWSCSYTQGTSIWAHWSLTACKYWSVLYKPDMSYYNYSSYIHRSSVTLYCVGLCEAVHA